VKARLSSTTALGPTGTRPGLGIEFAEDDFVVPDLAEKILEYLDS
jgi:hypothetical protein